MKYVLIAVVGLLALVGCYATYMNRVTNPGVERELREDPDGERAGKVMLIVLPSGRTLPVNYLREGDTVYAAADGRWWRELRGEGAPVEKTIPTTAPRSSTASAPALRSSSAHSCRSTSRPAPERAQQSVPRGGRESAGTVRNDALAAAPVPHSTPKRFISL